MTLGASDPERRTGKKVNVFSSNSESKLVKVYCLAIVVLFASLSGCSPFSPGTSSILRSRADRAKLDKARQNAAGWIQQTEALAREAKAQCNATKNQDVCMVHLELTNPPLFLSLVDDPRKEVEDLLSKIQDRERLCLGGIPIACLDFARQSWMFEVNKVVLSFSLQKPSSQDALTKLLDRFPVTPQTRRLVGSLRSHLRTDSPLMGRDATDASQLCASGDPVACFAAFFVRQKMTGMPQFETQTDLIRKLESDSISSGYRKLCESNPSSLACGKYLLRTASREDEIRYLDEMCNKEDGWACSRLTWHGERKEQKRELLKKACYLGTTTACEELVEPALVRGDRVEALRLAVYGCLPSVESDCSSLEKFFILTKDHLPKGVRAQEVAEHACRAFGGTMCIHRSLIGWRDGNREQARSDLGRLCDAGVSDACRYAAQIAFIEGKTSDAEMLLRQRCSLSSLNANACFELANLIRFKGDKIESEYMYADWCKKNEGIICRYRERLETGFSPTKLNDIFLKPIDGTKFSVD